MFLWINLISNLFYICRQARTISILCNHWHFDSTLTCLLFFPVTSILEYISWFCFPKFWHIDTFPTSTLLEVWCSWLQCLLPLFDENEGCLLCFHKLHIHTHFVFRYDFLQDIYIQKSCDNVRTYFPTPPPFKNEMPWLQLEKSIQFVPVSNNTRFRKPRLPLTYCNIC